MNCQQVMQKAIGLGLTLLLLSGCNTNLSVPSTSAVSHKVTPSVDVLLVNYFSDSGKFEVWLPTTQSIHENIVPQTTFGESVVCHVLWSKDNGAVWLVQYCDYTQEVMSKFSTQELLDETRDQALKNEHARLIEEHDISFNNLYPGRSITADVAMRGIGTFDGTYKARLYLVGNRVYCVAAKVYNENWGKRLSMMDPFLESFYIDGG